MAFRVRNSVTNSNNSNQNDLDISIFKEELNEYKDYKQTNKTTYTDSSKNLKNINTVNNLLKIDNTSTKYEKEIIIYDNESNSWKLIKESEYHKYNIN